MKTPSLLFQNDDNSYLKWKSAKLHNYPTSPSDAVVPITNPCNLTDQKLEQIKMLLSKTNLCVFQTPHKVNKQSILKLGRQLGMTQLDGNLCSDEDKVSSITVASDRKKSHYIPYTKRAIGWHTDGYYNLPEQTIRGFILYCVSDAASGGHNKVVDHELAYIHLRDINPLFITALSQKDALTIPNNVVDGVEIRPAQTGPVFSVDTQGHLHMRYTIRQRNVIWKDDPILQEATATLNAFLDSDHLGIFKLRLEPGQGIISNNVLHMRTAFEDSEGENSPHRLLYRARYFQRALTT